MKFDKNVPMPERTNKYDWSNMQPGDSIYFDSPKKADVAAMSLRQYIRIHKLAWLIAVRKEATGKRIWRTL